MIHLRLLSTLHNFFNTLFGLLRPESMMFLLRNNFRVRAIYLDDERQVPDKNWYRTRTVSHTIFMLKHWNVETLSLDHDLGHATQTGYDVLVWLEERVYNNPDVVYPQCVVHSANPVGRARMELTIRSMFERS